MRTFCQINLVSVLQDKMSSRVSDRDDYTAVFTIA